jgi:hypothetical protein
MSLAHKHLFSGSHDALPAPPQIQALAKQLAKEILGSLAGTQNRQYSS